MARGYATFKTVARDQYCSANQYNSHAEASVWAAAALKQLNLQANDILGKINWPVNSQPNGATII